MRLARATEDSLLGRQNCSPGGQRIRELLWDHPAAMPDPPGGWTSATNQGKEGERLGLAQAQKLTRSNQEPTSYCGPLPRPGQAGTQHSPLCSGLELPGKNPATCSRHAGAAVQFSSSCSRPSFCPPPPPLESTDLLSTEYPADEGSSEFLSPAQPPKCLDDLRVSRCESNPNSAKTGPLDGHHHTPASRTHRGAPSKDLRYRHNLLSHSNPHAHIGAPSLLTLSSGQIRNWSAREWTGALVASMNGSQVLDMDPLSYILLKMLLLGTGQKPENKALLSSLVANFKESQDRRHP